jgi:hypothetical protein
VAKAVLFLAPEDAGLVTGIEMSSMADELRSKGARSGRPGAPTATSNVLPVCRPAPNPMSSIQFSP